MHSCVDRFHQCKYDIARSCTGGDTAVGLFRREFQFSQSYHEKNHSQYPTLQLPDDNDILGIGGGYAVSRMTMKADSWQVGKSLKELALNKEGTNVLAISRKVSGKARLISPSSNPVPQAGDQLTVYGRDVALKCLFMREQGEAGEKIHQRRSKEQIVLNQFEVPT